MSVGDSLQTASPEKQNQWEKLRDVQSQPGAFRAPLLCLCTCLGARVCLVRCSYCVAINTFRSLSGVGLIWGDIADAVGSQSVLMSVTAPTKGR